MRSLFIWVISATCCLALILSGCNRSPGSLPPVSLKQNPTPVAVPSEVPTVSIFELVNEPQNYDQKLVRVRATAVATSELVFLYDSGCRGKNSWIDFAIDNEQASSSVSPFLDLSLGKHTPRRANITAVGRFDGPRQQGYGHLNSFRFHMLITAVEKAEATPDGQPWPWEETK